MAKQYCTQCGSANDSLANFCFKCGNSLKINIGAAKTAPKNVEVDIDDEETYSEITEGEANAFEGAFDSIIDQNRGPKIISLDSLAYQQPPSTPVQYPKGKVKVNKKNVLKSLKETNSSFTKSISVGGDSGEE